MALQRIETARPVAAIGLEPPVDLRQGLGAQAVNASLGVGSHADEARLAQHAQVLGNARLADRQRLDELTDRALALAQEVEDAAARRLGQDLECGRHAAYIAAQLYVCQAMRTPTKGAPEAAKGSARRTGSIRPMWAAPSRRSMSSCSTTTS